MILIQLEFQEALSSSALRILRVLLYSRLSLGRQPDQRRTMRIRRFACDFANGIEAKGMCYGSLTLWAVNVDLSLKKHQSNCLLLLLERSGDLQRCYSSRL
jgi:hypothetical protein